MEINKLQQFSAMHDWKAFQVGPGKRIPWDEIYVRHQFSTHLVIEEGNFDFIPRKIHERLCDSAAAVENIGEVPEFEFPHPACARKFKSVDDVELHMSVGQHREYL